MSFTFPPAVTAERAAAPERVQMHMHTQACVGKSSARQLRNELPSISRTRGCFGLRMSTRGTCTPDPLWLAG